MQNTPDSPPSAPDASAVPSASAPSVAPSSGESSASGGSVGAQKLKIARPYRARWNEVRFHSRCTQCPRAIGGSQIKSMHCQVKRVEGNWHLKRRMASSMVLTASGKLQRQWLARPSEAPGNVPRAKGCRHASQCYCKVKAHAWPTDGNRRQEPTHQ